MADRPNPYYTSGKLADPEFRRERARKAACARHSLSTYVAQVVARAGELSDEDLGKLRSLLPPVALTQDGGELDGAA